MNFFWYTVQISKNKGEQVHFFFWHSIQMTFPTFHCVTVWAIIHTTISYHMSEFCNKISSTYLWRACSLLLTPLHLLFLSTFHWRQKGTYSVICNHNKLFTAAVITVQRWIKTDPLKIIALLGCIVTHSARCRLFLTVNYVAVKRLCVWCGLSVCWAQMWALQKQLNRLRCHLGDSHGPKEPRITWELRSPNGKGHFREAWTKHPRATDVSSHWVCWTQPTACSRGISASCHGDVGLWLLLVLLPLLQHLFDVHVQCNQKIFICITAFTAWYGAYLHHGTLKMTQCCYHLHFPRTVPKWFL